MTAHHFVFSDIEGSTRLWQTHPDDMKAALASHDSVKDAIRSNTGIVFKHTGDGAAAMVESAYDAVVAPADVQRALASTVHPGIARVDAVLVAGVDRTRTSQDRLSSRRRSPECPPHGSRRSNGAETHPSFPRQTG